MPVVRRNGSESQSGARGHNRRRQAQQAIAEAEAKKRHSQRQRPRPVQEDEEEIKKTPLLLRILSLLGVILLCFVLGYLGTSWFVDFLNRKLLLKPENRIENQEDLTEFQDNEQERSTRNILMNGGNVQQISVNIYHVKDDTLVETRRNFIAKTREDNIKDAVTEIISASSIPNSEKIKLLHVFRNNETVFLDMPEQFSSALNAIGKQKSLLLITGILRTMQDNFPPISQVRFLIDSKPARSGGTVDLSSLWKLPKKTS
ncbi:MAG: GerMN domain-containing protein [Synergistaceae bacterium]|nr:GerMN domain-containing protein [Synergistaceae bacterium]